MKVYFSHHLYNTGQKTVYPVTQGPRLLYFIIPCGCTVQSREPPQNAVTNQEKNLQSKSNPHTLGFSSQVTYAINGPSTMAGLHLKIRELENIGNHTDILQPVINIYRFAFVGTCIQWSFLISVSRWFFGNILKCIYDKDEIGCTWPEWRQAHKRQGQLN